MVPQLIIYASRFESKLGLSRVQRHRMRRQGTLRMIEGKEYKNPLFHWMILISVGSDLRSCAVTGPTQTVMCFLRRRSHLSSTDLELSHSHNLDSQSGQSLSLFLCSRSFSKGCQTSQTNIFMRGGRRYGRCSHYAHAIVVLQSGIRSLGEPILLEWLGASIK